MKLNCELGWRKIIWNYHQSVKWRLLFLLLIYMCVCTIRGTQVSYDEFLCAEYLLCALCVSYFLSFTFFRIFLYTSTTPRIEKQQSKATRPSWDQYKIVLCAQTVYECKWKREREIDRCEGLCLYISGLHV